MQPPDKENPALVTRGLQETTDRCETTETSNKVNGRTRQAACENCGERIATPPSGRPKKFCSEKCKKASARRRVSGQKTPSGYYPTRKRKSDSEPPANGRVWGGQNRLFGATSPQPEKGKALKFEKVNEVTIKVTDGRPARIEGSLGQPGYIGTKALCWLMEIVPGRWVARAKDHHSDSLPLEAAKKVAGELCRPKAKGESRDRIRELDQLAAVESDRQNIDRQCRENAKLAAAYLPADLMGARTWRHTPVDPTLRRTIIETELAFDSETPKSADPIGYDDDGANIPAFLDRRAAR